VLANDEDVRIAQEVGICKLFSSPHAAVVDCHTNISERDLILPEQ
jgi:hypothetical protein